MVVREKEMKKNSEEITLTLILNKVCGGKYTHPSEFWAQLGQMFK